MSAMSLLKEAQHWYYKDRILLTDPPHCQRSDAVFPLCHENLYFVENFMIPENSAVLDLCAGSGIIAIFAAEKAKKVVAVDINPRAIEFAKINAELNGVADRMDFKVGNLFEPVKGMQFDVITANPPFEPTPSDCTNFLYSDGGEKGSKILAEIVNYAKEHLFTGGSLQIISYVREDQLDLLSVLNRYFREVIINELGVISASAYNDYLNRRLSILNPKRNLTVSNNLPIRYVYIKAAGLKNGR